MSNVSGLRPTDDNRPQVRQKKGRVTPNYAKEQSVGLSPSAAPVNTYAPPPRPFEDRRMDQLADALSTLNPALKRYAEAKKENAEEIFKGQEKYWAEVFRQDKEMGGVTATQVKERFPEMSPTVAAKVADTLGKQEAKSWAQERVQAIVENDELRLDTPSRREAIDAIRQEALEVIGGHGNAFYGNGFFTQLDASLGEFETAWMRETAEYHESVLKEGYSTDIANAIRNGGDTTMVDTQYGNTSSLSPRERKQLGFDAYIAVAVSEGAKDPLKANQVLDSIPTLFLNQEYKAKVADTRMKIEQMAFSMYSHGKAINEDARTRHIRDGKVDALTTYVQTGKIDPTVYFQTPEVFDYASQIMSRPRMPDPVSTRNAAAIRSRLLLAGTEGGFSAAFQNDPQFIGEFRQEEDVSEDNLRSHILNRTDLNPNDQIALLNEVPKLMAGVNWMRDPDVTTYYENTVGSDVKIYASGPFGEALQTLGFNVQGEVSKRFFTELARGVRVHVDSENEMPTAREKDEIIRKASEAASTFFRDNVQMRFQELAQRQGELMTQGASGGRNTTPKPQSTKKPIKIEVLDDGTIIEQME